MALLLVETKKSKTKEKEEERKCRRKNNADASAQPASRSGTIDWGAGRALLCN